MNKKQVKLFNAALVEMESLISENVNECIGSRNYHEGSHFDYLIEGLKRVGALIEETENLAEVPEDITDLGYDNVKWVADEIKNQVGMWKGIIRHLNNGDICTKEEEDDLVAAISTVE